MDVHNKAERILGKLYRLKTELVQKAKATHILCRNCLFYPQDVLS